MNLLIVERAKKMMCSMLPAPYELDLYVHVHGDSRSSTLHGSIFKSERCGREMYVCM